MQSLIDRRDRRAPRWPKRPARRLARCRPASQLLALRTGEVTRSHMARAFGFQRRGNFAADCLSPPAARVERAARGRVYRAGHITHQNDALALALKIGISERA